MNAASVKEITLREFSKYALAALVMTVPALMQAYVYGEAFHALLFIWMLIGLTALLSCLRISLWVFIPLMAVSLYSAFLMMVFGRIFGQFDYLAVINATGPETRTFLSANYGKVLGAVATTLVFCGYVGYFVLSDKGLAWIESTRSIRRKCVVAVLVMSVMPLLVVDKGSLLSTYPFACLSDLVVGYEFNSQACKYPSMKYEGPGAPLNIKEEGPVFILVIGESARRDAFGLYGDSCYASTPMVDGIVKGSPDNFIVFDRYMSVGQSTVPSVLSMFNPLGSEGMMKCFRKPNLVKFLSWAGYPVSVVKNQQNGFIKEYLEVEGGVSSLPEGSEDMDLAASAGDLSIPGGRVVILHTMGNHVSRWGLGTENYRRGIGDTDRVLRELFSKVLASSQPVCLWYVSDHGENLDTGEVHGSSNITMGELEVPSIIAASDSFMEKFQGRWNAMKSNKGRLLTHNNFSQTVMGLSGAMPEGYYNESRDVSSPGFKEESNPLLLPNNMIPMRYKSISGNKGVFQ